MHAEYDTAQEISTQSLLLVSFKEKHESMSIYYLDLFTVIELLHGMNAVVWTRLPHGIPVHSSPSIGYVRLKEGNIDICWIEGQNGFRLQGSLAIPYLQQIKEWTVDLEQEDQALPHVSPLPIQERSDGRQPSPPSFVRVRAFDELVFSQQRPLAPQLLDTLSHKERMIVRMVHLMMDGRRSIEHIRQTLNLSSSVVKMAVRTLQSVQAIQEINKE